MLNWFYYVMNGGLGLGGELFAIIAFLFVAWMFVHAIRSGEYLWAAFIFFFSGLSALLYFFFVYRQSGSRGNPFAGWEWPGAADRRAIKRLQAEIHHLDKPHLHLQLGDIYFNQGKLDKAEESLRAAYARDSRDEDIRAHLGVCLAQRAKLQEALPLLEKVVADNPRHDYGYTAMSLAETQAAVGQTDHAIETWRQVLALYSYPRARVQYGELLAKTKQYAEARKSLEEIVNDEPYANKFERKREAAWYRRAKTALDSIPAA